MSEEPTGGPSSADQLVAGVRQAVLHLGKAGVEVVAAVCAISNGVRAVVRPADEGGEPATGPQRIPVD